MAPSPPPSLRWIEPARPSDERVSALSGELGLPDEVARLLIVRGLDTPEAARRFLQPRFAHLHPPELLPDLERAVERVESALARREAILVHGDYDADGMAAAALLTRGLERLGARVQAFVPHRTRDGYDLGPAGLRRAREAGASLIVTADCGVSAREAVDAAGDAGVDVVVTDHHRPPPTLPDAVAVVNPAREESGYPFDGLAGVGVAFKLLTALYERAGLPEDELNRHLDLVALGTVADVVPLRDENRVLVRAGLAALERTTKPGLRALLRRAGLEGGDLEAGHVGYRLAPRLNAVGRVGEARLGLQLLLTDDAGEAGRLADRLERENRRRRTEDRRVQEEAERMLAERFDPASDRVVVLWKEGWHPGVIGIAASRIKQRVHRPTVLVSLEGDLGRGSARSIPGFHLQRALASCDSLLDRYGGHRMAAGLEVRRGNLEALAEGLEERARESLGPDDLVPELDLELAVSLARADDELHRWLSHLGPFGAENPRPVLLARGVAFTEASRVGGGDRHLKGTLRGPDGARLPAIGFGLGERAPEVESGERWDVAFELTENRYGGRRTLQARVLDFRPAAGEPA